MQNMILQEEEGMKYKNIILKYILNFENLLILKNKYFN